MLKTANRNLLFHVKRKPPERQESVTAQELDALLTPVDKIDFHAYAAEVFDLNRYRKVVKKEAVLRELNGNEKKPFVFVFYKN